MVVNEKCVDISKKGSAYDILALVDIVLVETTLLRDTLYLINASNLSYLVNSGHAFES